MLACGLRTGKHLFIPYLSDTAPSATVREVTQTVHKEARAGKEKGATRDAGTCVDVCVSVYGCVGVSMCASSCVHGVPPEAPTKGRCSRLFSVWSFLAAKHAFITLGAALQCFRCGAYQ